MSRILSNGPNEDYVDGPFEQMLKGADRASLASPYFTHSKSLVEAATSGTKIRLLVGLNLSTSPTALKKVYKQEGIEIRYRKDFHAKIYIFDDKALLGSANLSHNGLRANREAVIRLDRSADDEAINQTRALFDELWSRGKSLTKSKLEAFEKEREDQLERRKREGLSDPDGSIDAAVDHADWIDNILPNSDKPKKRVKEEFKLHKFYSDYIRAFNEIRSIIEVPRFQSRHMKGFHIVYETDRFLNFIHNSTELKREAKETASHVLSLDERQEKIIYFAYKWANAENPRWSPGYSAAIKTVTETFSTREAIQSASADDIFAGLKRLHCFDHYTTRYIPKPAQQAFMKANGDDLNFIQDRLIHLLHGTGDFITRIYDVSNREASGNLTHFGSSTAFELYGTVHPDQCPPINNRTVGMLNLLNFDVRRL